VRRRSVGAEKIVKMRVRENAGVFVLILKARLPNLCYSAAYICSLPSLLTSSARAALASPDSLRVSYTSQKRGLSTIGSAKMYQPPYHLFITKTRSILGLNIAYPGYIHLGIALAHATVISVVLISVLRHTREAVRRIDQAQGLASMHDPEPC